MRLFKKSFWMQTGLLILTILGIGFACWVMIPRWISSNLEPGTRIPTGTQFKLYQGKPPYDFSFEYPELWTLRETGYNNQYDLVQILGRKDPVTHAVPGFFVFKIPVQEKAGAVSREWMDARIQQESRLPGFKLVADQEIQFLDYVSRRVRYQFHLRLPFRSQNSQEVLLQKEIFWVQKNAFWYEITFSSTEDQAKALAPVWKHLRDTFRFNPDPITASK